MNTLHYKQFQAALQEAIDPSSWQNPFAVTLTLKLRKGALIHIDEIKASENVRHFRNRLNRSLLGKGCQRKRQCLPCLAVYEGTSFVRPHYHLCIERPETVTFEEFSAQIHTGWKATQWGYNEIDIQPCSNLDGWLNYMIKRRSKIDFASSIDWINTTGCVAKSCS